MKFVVVVYNIILSIVDNNDDVDTSIIDHCLLDLLPFRCVLPPHFLNFPPASVCLSISHPNELR